MQMPIKHPKIGIHFKATEVWRRTFDTAINAPAEGVQISGGGGGGKRFFGFF